VVQHSVLHDSPRFRLSADRTLLFPAIVDNSFGASAIPLAAAVLPALALLFILSQERGAA
jgi:hypothetical protein